MSTPSPAGSVRSRLQAALRTAKIGRVTYGFVDCAPLYDRADPASAVVARLQAGVVAQVKRCTAGWCHVAGNGFDGWIEQQRLWASTPMRRSSDCGRRRRDDNHRRCRA